MVPAVSFAEWAMFTSAVAATNPAFFASVSFARTKGFNVFDALLQGFDPFSQLKYRQVQIGVCPQFGFCMCRFHNILHIC